MLLLDNLLDATSGATRARRGGEECVGVQQINGPPLRYVPAQCSPAYCKKPEIDMQGGRRASKGEREREDERRPRQCMTPQGSPNSLLLDFSSGRGWVSSFDLKDGDVENQSLMISLSLLHSPNCSSHDSDLDQDSHSSRCPTRLDAT